MHSPCGQMGISPLKLLRRVRHREVKLSFTGQVLMAPLVALRILGSMTPVGVPLRVIMWHLQVRWARILSSSSASRWKQWRRPPRRVPELLLPLPVDSQNLDIVLSLLMSPWTSVSGFICIQYMAAKLIITETQTQTILPQYGPYTLCHTSYHHIAFISLSSPSAHFTIIHCLYLQVARLDSTPHSFQ